MTKSQLNQVETPPSTKTSTTSLPECADRQTCDVDGIIAGLDYETFVLLPGTMNARPGMKFADEMVEEPLEDSPDAQYFDFPSFGENAMGMQSMYFIQNPPPQYWAAQFVLASPPLDGKKSKKKNKKKRNKNKQRQQRLEREAQAAQKGQPLVAEDTSPETSPRLSPLKKVSKQNAIRKPLQTLNFTPKTPVSGDKKAAKKKRNKQRRRGKQLSVPPVLTFSPGSGRARRASHPGHLYEGGVDMMSLHFGSLSVNHESGLSGSQGTGFPKTGLPYPMRSQHPAKQRHYMSSPLLPRGPPLWTHHPIPLYGQAC